MRFVVAVAEERNFSRAAVHCNLSQPALSRRVQMVEEALGTKLFDRQTRRVRVTQAGKLFVREARRTLEQSRRTASLVQAFAQQKSRPVVVGLSILADLPRLHTLIKEAERGSTGSSLAIHAAHTPELVTGLLRGEVDLVVIDLPLQGRSIRTFRLATEPLAVALPDNLTLSKQPAPQLGELNTVPLVLLSQAIDPGRAIIDRALSSAGARAFKVCEVGSIPELLDQVALNGRVGLVRQSATRFHRQGVVYKPLAETIQVGCALAWRADDRWPALVSLREALAAFARQP
jgi:DNA-binding transcriptional LysR family regulator